MTTNRPIRELPPKPGQAIFRIALRLAVVAALAFVLLAAYEWVTLQVMSMTGIGQSSAALGVLVIVLFGYALMLATPFMPGVELGIALLMMEGAVIAPFVYLATVLGLFGAYVVGACISLDWLHRLFRDLHLMSVCDWITKIKNQPQDERLSTLTERLPIWLAKPLVDWRYVTIGILINLPGNIAIGGGGGILMMAGITRLFRAWQIALTLIIAVLPVPLFVWLTGTYWLI